MYIKILPNAQQTGIRNTMMGRQRAAMCCSATQTEIWTVRINVALIFFTGDYPASG
jgi:hypothetical protein